MLKKTVWGSVWALSLHAAAVTFLHLVLDAESNIALLASLPANVLVDGLHAMQHLVDTREPVAGHFKANVKAVVRQKEDLR